MRGQVEIVRLGAGDGDRARELFAVLASVFEEESAPLSDEYIAGLLERESFWAVAALAEGRVVGGLTAHTLPMTKSASVEVFLYDIAVLAQWQRRGLGRRLVEYLRSVAPGPVFVAADNEDTHALAFYRALGGEEAPVTMFTFSAGRR